MAGEASLNEDKKDGEETKKPKELIKDFCSYTTTHGIGRLAEAKTLFSRSIWTVFIIGAFAMFIFQTYGLFKLYLSRPVSTVVKVKHKSEVTFPAVTICNQNTIKNSEIPDYYIDQILKEIDEILQKEKKGDQKGDGTPTPTPDIQTITEDNSFVGNNDTDENYDPEEELRVDYLFEELLLSHLALENHTTLYKMGHKYKDFVFDCNFRGIDCRKNYSKYWHHFWDHRYGNCFTFNGGRDDERKNQTTFDTHSTGPFGGLKLNLFIESFVYVPELSQTAGARIVIHNQGDMPFPDEEGINLVPGFSTSVGVRREVIKRVDPFKNGSCRTYGSDDKENLYYKNFGSMYSRESCMRSCLAKIQIENCGCAEARFPIDDRYVCNTIKNPDSGFCLEDMTTKFDEEGLGCENDCPVPCSEVVYKTSMSMAEWPSEGYQQRLYNRVHKRRNPAYEDQLAEGPEFLNRNFLQVRVFFERLNFQEVREQLSYEEYSEDWNIVIGKKLKRLRGLSQWNQLDCRYWWSAGPLDWCIRVDMLRSPGTSSVTDKELV